MSISYSMTDNTFGGKLNSFKRRVDNAISTIGRAVEIDYVEELKTATQYKKVGGLHFAKINDMNVSWSFKKKPKAPLVQEPVNSTPCATEDDAARLQERMRQVMRR